MVKYKRILLKLSGEVLGGKTGFGIEAQALEYFTSEIRNITKLGVQVGLVIGGGNIFRGAELVKGNLTNKLRGDYMGMLATVINGIALQSAFERIGVPTRLITSFRVDKIGEIYNQDKVLKYLEEGNLIIFTGGTGNPYFTTDTAAALRAVEMNAELLIKGTKVDGVYSSDPHKNKDAIKYDKISFSEIYDKQLAVMDLTAITLCMENNLPLIVFDVNQPGDLTKVVNGEKIGTFVN